ncbi:MAG TPA: NAD-dependent epimerase/dehydratase family protein [bacterium]|nr:NAD-dependent epimerase/dehydratase family protein [bacterium]
MKALVTGVAGFIGSHLARELLARGWQVTGIDCFTDYYPRAYKENHLAGLRAAAGLALHDEDMLAGRLAERLDGVDVVFHLAAQAGVRASWGGQFDVYTDQNIRATQQLLELLKERPRVRLVNASSSSVYGDTPVLPMREDAPCWPVSPYGVTKLAAEHLCRLYQRSYGVPAVSLRFFTVYGPGQRPDMGFHRFLAALRDDVPVPLFGDGSQTRDFTYVSDIVAGIIAAAERGTPGAVYNLGGGSRVSLNGALALAEQVSGRTLRRAAQGVARGDMRDTWAELTLAQRDLGYQPAVMLAEGLAAEWAWLNLPDTPREER